MNYLTWFDMLEYYSFEQQECNDWVYAEFFERYYRDSDDFLNLFLDDAALDEFDRYIANHPVTWFHRLTLARPIRLLARQRHGAKIIFKMYSLLGWTKFLPGGQRA